MPRGRPKAFDEEACVDQAMTLFWDHGYDATSLDDLTEALGIGPSSLYRTFGSKEGLFERCIARYEKLEGNLILIHLDGSQPVVASLQHLLEASAAHYCRPSKPKGCFVVLTSVDRCGAPDRIDRLLKKRRQAAETFMAKFIRSGKERGEVAYDTDEAMVAKFVFTTMQGMSLQARDGVRKSELQKVAQLAGQSLESIAVPQNAV